MDKAKKRQMTPKVCYCGKMIEPFGKLRTPIGNKAVFMCPSCGHRKLYVDYDND